MNKGVVIGVAVAIAAALGFFAQQKMRQGSSLSPAPVAGAQMQTAAGEANGAQSAARADAATPKVPDVLPDFRLADREGIVRNLQHWAGRPLMVNYWATWCGPCRREIPLLNALRKQRAAQKLEIVGIAVDFRDDVLGYAEDTVIDYPLLIGEEDGLAAVTAMGMQPAFPFTVFADSRQRVVWLKVGELHQDEADFILDRVVAIDAGKLALADARAQITEGLKEIATRRANADAPAATAG